MSQDDRRRADRRRARRYRRRLQGLSGPEPYAPFEALDHLQHLPETLPHRIDAVVDPILARVDAERARDRLRHLQTQADQFALTRRRTPTEVYAHRTIEELERRQELARG